MEINLSPNPEAFDKAKELLGMIERYNDVLEEMEDYMKNFKVGTPKTWKAPYEITWKPDRYCESCGGPSRPAPNQYRGYVHSKDCKAEEMHNQRKEIWAMEKEQKTFKDELFLTLVRLWEGTELEMLIKLKDPSWEIRTHWDPDSPHTPLFLTIWNGYDIVAEGAPETISDWIQNPKDYMTVGQILCRD